MTTTAWAITWHQAATPTALYPLAQGPEKQVRPYTALHGGQGTASWVLGAVWGQRMSVPCLFYSSSQEYQSAQASLTRSFQGKFDKFVVPCVVASGDTKDRKGTEMLSFRCGALGRGAGWSLSLPTATQVPVGRAQGLALPSANPHHSQSPQHTIPGAVVSSGSAVYRGNVRQRQDRH